MQEGSVETQHYGFKIVNKVERLRLKLQSAGSDLLIVNGFSEKIIPSLARVLQTGEVIALVDNDSGDSDIKSNSQQLKSDMIGETGHLLSRHSIDFKIIKPNQQQFYKHTDLTFPPFPEIETGTVPHF